MHLVVLEWNWFKQTNISLVFENWGVNRFVRLTSVFCSLSSVFFCSIDKVARIVSPTLIIHGTDDEIIGIHHGHELYSRLKYPLEPAWIEGAGHNDIELFAEYAIRLDRFFNEDLGSGSECPTALWTGPSPCMSPIETLSPRQSSVRSAFSTKQNSNLSRKTRKKSQRHRQSSHCGSNSNSTRPANLSTAHHGAVVPETAFVATNGHLRSDSVRSSNPQTSRAQSTHGCSQSPDIVSSSGRVWTTRMDEPGSQLCHTSTLQETLSSSESGTGSSNCSRSSSGVGRRSSIANEGSGTRRRSKSSPKTDSILQQSKIPNETKSVRTTTITTVSLPKTLDSVEWNCISMLAVSTVSSICNRISTWSDWKIVVLLDLR